MAGASTGGGGVSNSSSAASRSGDAGSGSGSVNVGGFNPPAWSGSGSFGGNSLPWIVGGVALVAAVYFFRKK